MKSCFALLLAGTLLGCSGHVGPHSAHFGIHREPRYAQPSVIPCFGTGLLGYTVYYGSDEKYHYFEAQHDLKLDRYKVPRWSLESWKPVFPVGKGRVYVQRNAQAELIPIPPKPARR